MKVEVISINNAKDNLDCDSIKNALKDNGFEPQSVNSVPLSAKKIKSLLDVMSVSPEKPDTVIISNALNTQDSKAFKKYFASVVASAEHAENTPAPKDYWKKRRKAFIEAKNQNYNSEQLDELKNQFQLYRSKSKILSLGDFGNGYKGYCFVYKNMKIGVLPVASLAGVSTDKLVALGAVRTESVFEKSSADYPNGFSKVPYTPPKQGFVNRFIPLRGDGAREISRKCIVIASFLVFVGALSLLLYNMVYLSMQNDMLNGEIQTIYHSSQDNGNKADDNKPSSGNKIDWDKLKAINPEIVGWITIKNMIIDYPVLWHKSDTRESQYYLTHNYKNEYSQWGSVFVDYRCTKGTESKNLVLHGHHMNDGTMFGNLLKYGGTTGDLSFYKKSPTITFNTPKDNGTYKIISVFKTNTLSSQGEFFNYMIGNFQNDKDFMNYVYNVRVRSLFNCPVDVNEDDTLLTLSTCSYEFTNFRTVVVARKVRANESTKVDTSKASLNSNAVWPNVYYSRYGGTRPQVTDFCTAYDKKQIDWYDGDYDFEKQKVVDTSTKPTTPTEKKSNSNSSSSKVTTTAQPTTQAKVYLTVKFINYDGSTISTQKVEYGKSAVAPPTPTKPSDDYYDYVFKGWQLDFSNVVSNMTIAPNFEAKRKSNT